MSTPNADNTAFVPNVREMQERHHVAAVEQREALKKRFGRSAGNAMADAVASGDKRKIAAVNHEIIKSNEMVKRRVGST